MQGVVHVVVGGADSASVVMVTNAFEPPSVTVAPGGSVLWRNFGSLHTVTSLEPTPTKPTTWGRIKALYR
jgi:plastocyanin